MQNGPQDLDKSLLHWVCGVHRKLEMTLQLAERPFVSHQVLLNHFNTLRPRQNGRRFADNTFKCIFLNENVWISIKISLKFVPKGPMNNNPALVQIMAWRRSGDKPLSEPMMVSLLTHICVARPQWVNILRLEQNCWHFADDMFKCIFFNENFGIQISLNFIPKGPIDNKPALVQIMACWWAADKPLSEPMMLWFTWCIYASLDFNVKFQRLTIHDRVAKEVAPATHPNVLKPYTPVTHRNLPR